MKKEEYVKGNCPHCCQSIEFPEEGTGQTIPCPTCEIAIVLRPGDQQQVQALSSESSPPRLAKKPVRSSLPRLTHETIRAKTKSGDIPLHRAARNGQFALIPESLLSIELFLAKNNAGETPVHLAAKSGHLDKVPRQFLTRETLTIKQGDGTYDTGSGYKAQTETPLHIAARCGYADQIPHEFLTPEFLSLEATGYRTTLLHDLAVRIVWI